jgi:ABC-type uncharacterized transport system permease subunit
MERTADVPKEIAIIIQGIIILFVASRATGIASDTKNKEEGN